MKNQKTCLTVFVMLFTTWTMAAPVQKPLVCPLFSDNMVLQRDQIDPIWGWSKPGDIITVSINGQSVSTTTDSEGKWTVKVQPPPTGGPYELEITGPQNQKVNLRNVMVGDVWICSGQSNMTLGVKLINNAKAEIEAADHPYLRFYDKDDVLKLEPYDQTLSSWRVCTPSVITDSGMGFTATGYFFGRDLQADLKVPIGLIHTSWGGVPIEGWTSATALKKATPDFDQIIQRMDEICQQTKEGSYNYENLKEQWYESAGAGKELAAPDFDDSSWKSINLPASLNSTGLQKMPEGKGVVYFRKNVRLAVRRCW